MFLQNNSEGEFQMSKENEIAFLCKRLKELREKNDCTMEEMAQKLAVNGIAPNKSSISRVEAGKTSEKTLLETARKYCEKFGMSEEQTNQFLHQMLHADHKQKNLD